jgi:hypothetical protein
MVAIEVVHHAFMKYLEDTLAEQCLSKTLYPNTKIIVRRQKVEGRLLTYTNELEVEIDFTDVDPQLLQDSTELARVPALLDSGIDSIESKPRASRFFNRSN